MFDQNQLLSHWAVSTFYELKVKVYEPKVKVSRPEEMYTNVNPLIYHSSHFLFTHVTAGCWFTVEGLDQTTVRKHNMY